MQAHSAIQISAKSRKSIRARTNRATNKERRFFISRKQKPTGRVLNLYAAIYM